MPTHLYLRYAYGIHMATHISSDMFTHVSIRVSIHMSMRMSVRISTQRLNEMDAQTQADVRQLSLAHGVPAGADICIDMCIRWICI